MNLRQRKLFAFLSCSLESPFQTLVSSNNISRLSRSDRQTYHCFNNYSTTAETKEVPLINKPRLQTLSGEQSYQREAEEVHVWSSVPKTEEAKWRRAEQCGLQHTKTHSHTQHTCTDTLAYAPHTHSPVTHKHTQPPLLSTAQWLNPSLKSLT